LDASSGPIYIGKNVHISIGTLIQGPACILDGASTNIGAKIRPNCTIGQGCKIGGEINQSIFYPFSNKAHDGYLGSSIIGSFSNLGALSTCSNLKNDLQFVDIFDYTTKEYRMTSEKNLGVFMGDYVTTGIMTKFNTGSSIGSHCNLSSKEFLPKHVPSFTWGEFPQLTIYRFEKALNVAKAWIILKGQHIPENLEQRMEEIWKEMSTFRT
jgi:NDP-sugar pyrophosphorylase family protein